jgi:opacity protein-like surface antigen
MLNPKWFVKAEYLYYDFNVNNNSWIVNTATGNFENNWRWFNNDLTINIVKLGLNYHIARCHTRLK